MAARKGTHVWTTQDEENLINLRKAGHSYEAIGAIIGVSASAAQCRASLVSQRERINRSYEIDTSHRDWEQSCVAQNELFARAMLDAGYKRHTVTSSDHNPQRRYRFDPQSNIFSRSNVLDWAD